uniref:Uncharacterized protein n=1 Tax=Ananas comosus var. bracteatus TaxID=296719 RepID=A0A6V7NJ24_ANACO|nr:unnamed protein product [Ananas comosus var. bracteatus]
MAAAPSPPAAARSPPARWPSPWRRTHPPSTPPRPPPRPPWPLLPPNNAGVGCTGPLAELSLAAVRHAWEVNALGQLRLVRAVAAHMAARRSGLVVNVGSVVGRVATPWAGAYCASKAAAHAATDALPSSSAPSESTSSRWCPGQCARERGRLR